MDTLETLIRKNAPGTEIAQYLDGMSTADRLTQVETCPRQLFQVLWQITKGQSIDARTMVPEDDKIVIYRGRNSMPAFRLVEKRFWRRGEEVIGLNDHPFTWFSGPGYFVAFDGGAGEVHFDYNKAPSFRPDGWPDLAPNRGFGPGVVFGNMLDYNRTVSKTTVMGLAYKSGKSLDTYYVMTRLSG